MGGQLTHILFQFYFISTARVSRSQNIEYMTYYGRIIHLQGSQTMLIIIIPQLSEVQAQTVDCGCCVLEIQLFPQGEALQIVSSHMAADMSDLSSKPPGTIFCQRFWQTGSVLCVANRIKDLCFVWQTESGCDPIECLVYSLCGSYSMQ